MDIHMSPSGVHTAGDDLASLSSSAAANVGHSLDASDVAAGAHGGWAAATAVRACREDWAAHLTDLVGQVRTAAQKLHDSAATAEQADVEAARRLHAVLNELAL